MKSKSNISNISIRDNGLSTSIINKKPDTMTRLNKNEVGRIYYCMNNKKKRYPIKRPSKGPIILNSQGCSQLAFVVHPYFKLTQYYINKK